MKQLSHLFPTEESIPSKFRLDRPILQDSFLCDGEIVKWKGESIPVYSPIYVRKRHRLAQKKLGSYPALTKKEAFSSLQAAKKAFSHGNGEWPSLSLSGRIGCIKNFIGRLTLKKETIVKILMWEIAKPFHELEDEFERTIGYLDQVLEVARKKEKSCRVLKREKGIVGLVRDEPLGVALCMGPYNYPFFETLCLVLPALLMGNTVILKPPRFGVLFFKYLEEDFKECFPRGAVNTIYGDGKTVIEPLMRSGEVDVFAFIGSSRVANHLMNLHPRKNRLHSLLGLEAKNVAVVLPDADFETTIKESILGALAFNGQRCAALKIFFVHQDIVEAFLSALKREIGQVKAGMPWVEGVRITPMADPERVSYLKALVEDAWCHGARILNKNGGEVFKSLFFPTVLYPVNSGMRIYSEEQFGPIIPVVSYEKIEEPVKYTLDSNFGQQMSVFGTNVRPISALLSSVKSQVSRININAKCQRGPDTFPFTGRKDSAKGDFSTSEILNLFSARSTITARENEWGEWLFKAFRKQ